jgi:hypothetical protein
MFANRFYLFIVLILIFTTIIISTPINKYDRSSKSIESLNDNNNNNNLDVKQNDDDDDDDDDNQNDIKENLIKINRQRFRTQQRHKDLEPLTD